MPMQSSPTAQGGLPLHVWPIRFDIGMFVRFVQSRESGMQNMPVVLLSMAQP